MFKNQLERILYCHSIQAFDLPAGLTDKSGIKVPDLKEEISAFQFECVILFILYSIFESLLDYVTSFKHKPRSFSIQFIQFREESVHSFVAHENVILKDVVK